MSDLIAFIPPGTPEWPHFKDIPPTCTVNLPDGLYASVSPSGALRKLVRCEAGKVEETLRFNTSGPVLGRYDNPAFGQEYQKTGSGTFLEDFGGRIEGPGNRTELSFDEWAESQVRSICSPRPARGYRPNPEVFLNSAPSPFFGERPIRKGSGTAGQTGFYPCAFGYELKSSYPDESLAQAAAGLYLKDPLVRILEKTNEVTGFAVKINYSRLLFVAEHGVSSLFGSVLVAHPLVVVGLCSSTDRSLAEEAVLGCQKLFLQGMYHDRMR